MQEMLRALRCPCGWTPEETGQVATVGATPADDFPPIYPTSRSYPSTGRGGSGTARSGTPNAESRSSEAPNAQALREMGFREPMIRVAQEFARGRGSAPALQLLLLQPGVDSQVSADGERLARAIQEAVLNCDTDSQELFRERLLRVVALLSVEEANLSRAQGHLSSEAMKDFLDSLVRNRVKAWPPECSSATRMAIEMLARFPNCSAAGSGGGPEAAQSSRTL